MFWESKGGGCSEPICASDRPTASYDRLDLGGEVKANYCVRIGTDEGIGVVRTDNNSPRLIVVAREGLNLVF
jgi:hypothetical protein